MENRELMIGNIVSYKSSVYLIGGISYEYELGFYADLGVVKSNVSKEFDYNLKVLVSELKPIRMTKSWLFTFNFEYKRKKDGTQGVYSNGKMNVVLSNSGNVYTTRNKLIPYVHTFQNIYYFDQLTGEELKTTEQ